MEPYAFSAPGFDEVADLHGDVAAPDLVVFMGGNEFMVLPDLLAAFRAAHPDVRRIYVETLPPGVLAERMRRGALQVGTLRVTVAPDVLTGGKDRIERAARDGVVEGARPYASNRLGLMVRAGNPKGVRTLGDLAREDVRVALPDRELEDIGKKVDEALVQEGGEDLVAAVTREKVAAGTTQKTLIHHRQTPAWIAAGEADAGPVWWTEVLHQRERGAAIDGVELPRAPRSTSLAAVVTGSSHRSAAERFVEFLASPAGRAVFERHGFDAPDAR